MCLGFFYPGNLVCRGVIVFLNLFKKIQSARLFFSTWKYLKSLNWREDLEFFR